MLEVYEKIASFLNIFTPGILVGLLIGYCRIYGIFKRYYIYDQNMTSIEANQKIIKIATSYKYMRKKFYNDK